MSDFFGWPIQSQSTASMTVALVLAVLLGGFIGIEREIHGHPAGLRTHILVCVGSTLITLVSVHSALLARPAADPTRITAQIVSGIGFLGAGAIIREGASIRGLTTAASLWATAAIGMAVGTGPAVGELGVIATGIVVFTLWLMNRVEDWIEERVRRTRVLEIHIHESSHATAGVLARIADQGVDIRSIDYERDASQQVRQMLMRVRLPERFNRTEFLTSLGDEPGVHSIAMR